MATIQERPRVVDIRKKAFYTPLTAWTVGLMVLIGEMIVWLTVLNFLPFFYGAGAAPAAQVVIPPFDYDVWRQLAVEQGGRYKPFETSSRELMRQIHGRDRILGMDAVPVVLMWMLEIDPKSVERKSQWDEVAFILCEHHDLRRLIHHLQDDGTQSAVELTHEEEYGKYIAPKKLKDLRAKLERVKEQHPDRYKQIIEKYESQFNETFHRLTVYNRIRDLPDPNAKKSDDPLAFVALDQVKNAPWFSIGTMRLVGKNAHGPDKLWHGIMKERVQHAPHIYVKPEQLQALAAFQEKVLAKQGGKAIDELATVVAANRAALVKEYLQLRADKKEDEAARLLAKNITTWPEGKNAKEAVKRLHHHLQVLFGKEGEARVAKQFDIDDVALILAGNPYRLHLAEAFKLAQQEPEKTAQAFDTFLTERDESVLADLRTQLPGAKEYYVPAEPKYRLLHLTYLETRYPGVYIDAALWQKVPLEDMSRVLKSFDELGQAWRADLPVAKLKLEAAKLRKDNKPEEADQKLKEAADALIPSISEGFSKASQAFMTTLREVSEKTTKPYATPYPGPDTVGDRVSALFSGSSINPPSEELLGLELTFNRVAPFRWGWITMLVALVFFILSMGLDSKWCYRLGLGFCAISLAFQAFGFSTRVLISGRAPVTNMYETVIWVSFMATIFALILEAIYRSKVIALGGALVACIGLVLADNLPLALDPKISPLVPVLRSNFWLTIHVLTIVSSYGAGALAWGLGNLALVFIVFNKGSRESIKTLSNFTYRALQLAVLLLAAGTFLGGWWAAYSWGRFWGWDPKETGALIALLCYVIPLHMRQIGWIKDFGLAVAAILCFASVMLSWWGINFWIPAGLHSYGMPGGDNGGSWVAWIMLLNVEWVLAATLIYKYKQLQGPGTTTPTPPAAMA